MIHKNVKIGFINPDSVGFLDSLHALSRSFNFASGYSRLKKAAYNFFRCIAV